MRRTITPVVASSPSSDACGVVRYQSRMAAHPTIVAAAAIDGETIAENRDARAPWRRDTGPCAWREAIWRGISGPGGAADVRVSAAPVQRQRGWALPTPWAVGSSAPGPALQRPRCTAGGRG